jgi:hypothetical protein
MLIQTIEENACNLTQNLLGREAPIGQIAAGRLRAISHKEQMSPPLPLLDQVTPEDVVQIGKDSLAEAIQANNDALMSLKLATEPGEIPPTLQVLIDAISPKPVFVPYTTPTKGGTILAMQNIPPSLLNSQIQLSADFQKSQNSDPSAGAMTVNCSDREQLFSSDYGSIHEAVEALSKEPRKGDLLLLKNFFQLGESDRQKVLTIVDYFLNGDGSLRSNGRNESNAGLVLVS